MNEIQNGSGISARLEECLRQQSLSSGAPLPRLRKMVAFDRFVARGAKKQPDAWIKADLLCNCGSANKLG
jgi:hypothetical protein